MKRFPRSYAMALAALIALAAWCRPALADETIPCEKRLPKNVLAYVSLRNIADFKEQWSKTLYGKAGNDPSLAEFRDELVKQIAEGSKQLEDQLGLSLSDLAEIPHGEIAAAVFARGGAKIGIVLVMDFGDREETVQKLLAKATDALENEGQKRSEEEVEDSHVIVFKKPPVDDEAKQQAEESAAWCIKDSFLVVGSDLADVKEVLTRWDGKHDRVLAENDVFRYIVDKCRDDNADAQPQLTWFVDPVALVQAAIASQPQALGQMAMFAGAIPMIGFDKFKGLGGTFDMARGDFDMVSRTLVYLDQPAKGVVNLVQFDPKSQAPPKWLSAEWSGYSALNWNIAKAYSGVEGLVDMFQGPGALAQLIQSLADNEQSGGIHLKKDVLDQFTGTIHVAEDDGGDKEGADTGYLFAVELKNVAAFRATLAKAARIPGVKLDEREFQGETIYEFGAGAGGDEEGGEGAAGVHFGFTVSAGCLMVATDVRLMERVLRGVGDGETLADSAGYKRIAHRFPGQTASISYSRQDSQVRRFYELLKGGQAAALAGPLQALDFSKLPDFDTIKKYIPASGSYMERDDRGLRITSFSLGNDSE
jgi:hypothetical protein